MKTHTKKEMEEKDVYCQDLFNPYAFQNEKSDRPVWLVTYTNAQKYDSISSQFVGRTWIWENDSQKYSQPRLLPNVPLYSKNILQL